MFRLSDNYYNRQCYLERNQVPTLSIMERKMTPLLSKVYFQSMKPKLKVLAGLEPPLKGGGGDWHVPPTDLLEGRAVLKPLKKKYLKKLGCYTIETYGEDIVRNHHKSLQQENHKALLNNDLYWKRTIPVKFMQDWEYLAKEESAKNTEKVQRAFNEFTNVYLRSMIQMETLLMTSIIKEMRKIRGATYKKMSEKFDTDLKLQATMLYDDYKQQLDTRKAQLKGNFLNNIRKARDFVSENLHDINVDKHTALEKLRVLLKCENLACQIYVALKEKEECKNEMEVSKQKHKKSIGLLKEQIAMRDFELQIEIEKEKKRQELLKIWKQKICHVLKKFQIFVAYCLHSLPEYADFFINMEKLMLMQLSEAFETPTTSSIFETEPHIFETEPHIPPVAKPHPFYLVCDKGYKLRPDQHLCPKHCTSSASQLPVIVVNKRFIYAACDNFDEYTDLVTQYIYGQRGDDADFEDRHNYQLDVPVKYTSSQQLLELKLESSLMQVVQEESNVRRIPIVCSRCRTIHCFCSPIRTSKMALTNVKKNEVLSLPVDIPSGNKIGSRREELKHEREPTWDQYLDYIQPKKCACGKASKKYVRNHMPAYMRNTSKYTQPELPNYEPCSSETLKKLVENMRGKRTLPPEPEKVESKTRDMSTQYEDVAFQGVCDCFSDDEIAKLFENPLKDSMIFNVVKTNSKFIVGGDVASAYLSDTASSFATKRVRSMRYLLQDTPELEELFKRKHCH